ncbi:hypothetical protein V8E53_001511 [Lactarius tabidus]
MAQLKRIFRTTDNIFFHACYDLPADPLKSDSDHVSAVAHEIWQVTGYRFRIKDNLLLETSHKTRYWCCQDQNRKQKSRAGQREGAKHRDTLGMHRYDCKSKLNISYRANPRNEEMTYKITIWLEHHMKHPPYYDWFTPHEVAKKVLQIYPSITANQVHAAWTTMSETLWKRSRDQLPSIKALLGELGSDVALLDLPGMEGVEQVAWVMKGVLLLLQGKIVEIGIDATYNTNSRHLELYTILGEYDNAGFPLSYCLLTTATSIEDRKRTKALEAWAAVLCHEYNIVPRFVHTDKDMAEIGATDVGQRRRLHHHSYSSRRRLEAEALL